MPPKYDNPSYRVPEALINPKPQFSDFPAVKLRCGPGACSDFFLGLVGFGVQGAGQPGIAAASSLAGACPGEHRALVCFERGLGFQSLRFEVQGFWGLFGAFWVFWCFLGRVGAFWGHLGPFGTFCFLGLWGAFWGGGTN